ncbi:aminopeptidase P family protein [Propioniciclava coleopterorum]|uniref:Xaa-Pro aminopeptidase n=1 Tax=Propioniciclava coleopterorum TaxID=2714937 RepID=A0A6G7Y7T5_9ACTN|nr:aminopeptidase P family protein [Propioniciclava coleopterorum]QIK72853.1 aminopeptidase P family protein [Propioniciclava coleopterorum]
MSQKAPQLPNRQTPFSDAFVAFIPTKWAPYSEEMPAALPASEFAPARRDAVSAAFPGERIVVPAGNLVVRSNDTDYNFRPHSAFAHLTGLGADREPDAVLVLEPTFVENEDGKPECSSHEATLYFKPRAPRTDAEFYADARYGEMWVGQRESLEEMAAMTGLQTRSLHELPNALSQKFGRIPTRMVRDVDASLTTLVDDLRRRNGGADPSSDDELAVMLSELRLIKDDFELEQLQAACDATTVGFEAVAADLPTAVRNGRGERWCEGVFELHARHLGNGVGYGSICASGDHANTLHWIRNDGDLHEGDLILCDMGVEVDTLYTADVTRTLPISGTFTPAQRKVYDAVLAAQNAGIAAARAGASFSDVHDAAIRVVAEHLHAWGILPVPVEESLDPVNGGQHRRWMVHGTSHHLGLDVHDCAQARREFYRDGKLREGMVITVEPGIYFKSTDLLVPEELRGIGVRIEDDIVITDGEARLLSDALPREADDVEAWLARQQA